MEKSLLEKKNLAWECGDASKAQRQDDSYAGISLSPSQLGCTLARVFPARPYKCPSTPPLPSPDFNSIL